MAPAKARGAPADHRAEMDLGLYIAASGMIAEQARQDQLANDLANASTPGYKPDESTQGNFGSVLLSNTMNGHAIGSIATNVSSGATHTNLSAAPIHETGRPLDFAIQGEGFFAVRTSEGVRYTRDGQFAASSSGLLTDSFGNVVLSQSGQPIQVSAEGAVSGSEIGVFKLAGAVKQGESLFTGKPEGQAEGSVREGALEESGIDPVKAMVEMMGSLRAFQSGQQAIQAIDQTLQAASSQVGSITG